MASPHSLRSLLLGRDGQLGSALRERLAGLGEVVAVGREGVDLADPRAVRDLVATLRPDMVFNAAAYTAVDRAETERDVAFAVNAHAPAALADACARHRAVLFHYSTDYVFDGEKDGPYGESDPASPINAYGESKLAGERAVLDSGVTGFVLRTSWVYGDRGANFAATILRLATQRDALRVVDDQRGAPTWAGRLADASVSVVAMARQQAGFADWRDWLAERSGLYHACAAGDTTWADYARRVLSVAATDPAYAARLRIRDADVEGIPTSDYPTPARRPRNSRLDCSRFAAAFGYVFPGWTADLDPFVRRRVSET